MAKLTIEVKGLALCYIADDVWNVVLICDGHHPARIYKNTRNLGDFQPASGVKQAGIDLGTTSYSAPATGADFDRIINLSAPYAHGARALSVDVKTNARALHIKVPSAKAIPGSKMHSNDCYVQEHPGNGSPPVLIAPKAKTIVFEIQVADQQAATMNIEGFAVPIELAGPNETGVQITFDNDCRGNCRTNDSILIYDWLSSSDGRKFYTGHVFGRDIKFPTLAEIHEWSHGEADGRPESRKSLATARMGNCDPVVFEP